MKQKSDLLLFLENKKDIIKSSISEINPSVLSTILDELRYSEESDPLKASLVSEGDGLTNFVDQLCEFHNGNLRIKRDIIKFLDEFAEEVNKGKFESASKQGEQWHNEMIQKAIQSTLLFTHRPNKTNSELDYAMRTQIAQNAASHAYQYVEKLKGLKPNGNKSIKEVLLSTLEDLRDQPEPIFDQSSAQSSEKNESISSMINLFYTFYTLLFTRIISNLKALQSAYQSIGFASKGQPLMELASLQKQKGSEVESAAVAHPSQSQLENAQQAPQTQVPSQAESANLQPQAKKESEVESAARASQPEQAPSAAIESQQPPQIQVQAELANLQQSTQANQQVKLESDPAIKTVEQQKQEQPSLVQSGISFFEQKSTAGSTPGQKAPTKAVETGAEKGVKDLGKIFDGKPQQSGPAIGGGR